MSLTDIEREVLEQLSRGLGGMEELSCEVPDPNASTPATPPAIPPNPGVPTPIGK